MRSPLQEAQHLCRRAGLSERLIAEATGTEPSTVRSWSNGRSEPSGVRAERLIELSEITDRLTGIVRPEVISAWLIGPNVALNDERPIDLIARGEHLAVARVISGLEYMVAS